MARRRRGEFSLRSGQKAGATPQQRPGRPRKSGKSFRFALVKRAGAQPQQRPGRPQNGPPQARKISASPWPKGWRPSNGRAGPKMTRRRREKFTLRPGQKAGALPQRLPGGPRPAGPAGRGLIWPNLAYGRFALGPGLETATPAVIRAPLKGASSNSANKKLSPPE